MFKHTQPKTVTNQSALTFVLAVMALLVTTLFPTTATALPPAQQDAPEAPLDTPTIIVDEYSSEWLIYKGVVYWSNHENPIDGLANAPAIADTPNVTITLKRKPVGGGAVTTLGTDTVNTLNFRALAVDDSGAYFFDGISKIKRIRTSGNSPTPVTTDVTTVTVGFVNRIKLDGNFVYFSTNSSGIFRVPKSGGAAQMVQATNLGVTDFIMNAQSIYWFDSTGLWWGPKTCATSPCSKAALSSGARGRNMAFGFIGEAGSSPGSIIFVSNSGPPNFRDSIIELNCQTPNVCQIQTFYNAAQGWGVGRFREAYVPISGPFPILDTTLFWPETDSGSNTGKLLRRYKNATAATPSEIYPGTSSLQHHIETDSKGVYFADVNKIMFLPFTASSITRDLAVANIEVTQAIQNLANQIGLVADKSTYARVYGKQLSGPPAGSIELVLHGTRNGLPLPGSPLQPLEGNVSLSTSFVFDRAKRQDAWLFRLPSSWITSGNIVLRAEVDPRKRYEDPVPANNSLSQNAAFGNEPDACLFFSPVRTHNPIPKIGDPNFWPTIERFARVWPVPGVEVRSLSEPIEELQACYWHGIPHPCWGPYELDEGTSLTNFPSDKDRVIGKLMLRQAIARGLSLAPLAGICESGATVHAVGLVHPEADTTDDDGTLTGYANYYINASFYKMEPFDSQPPAFTSNTPPWVWPDAASTLAQEVTHNFNRRHAACGTNDDTDGSWPYVNKCQLNDGGATNYYGFDVKSRRPIPPEIASDFMSYTPSFSEAPKWKGQWVSDYTYSAVKGKFGLQASTANLPGFARPALPEAGEMIYAIGAIEPISNLGHLEYAYAQPLAEMSAQARNVWQEFSTPIYDRSRTALRSDRSSPTPNAGDVVTYHLRLKDASGAVLDDRAITPFLPDMHDGEHPAWPFLLTFPAPSGNVTKMELMADSTVLDVLNVGPATPTVDIVSPKASDTITDALVIQWQGNDADAGDTLRYNVQYSADNGTSWVSLVEDYPGTPGAGEALVVQNPLALPGTNGATGRIRIYASDGYHTGSALAGAFSVAQRAPEAHITSPNATLSYEPNDDVPLQGGALDAESGMLTGTALTWVVGGASRTGEESSVRGLKPGTHAVSLMATDNTSRTGSTQTTLHINPLVANASNFAPVLDGACDDAVYSTNGSQIQLAPYADGAQATAQLMLSGSKLWLCFTGLARGSEAQVGRAGLFADVNTSQDINSQVDDVGFFVTEDGVGIAMLGNGDAGDATQLDARVTATSTVWTAEMSIDLVSLGGNASNVGHVIGARLSHSFVNSASDAVAWPYLSQAGAPNSWGQTVLGNWPMLDEISPISASVGSGNVVITLTGSNFVSSTVALLNFAPATTTFISPTQMSVVVPADRMAVAGIVKVQVASAGELSAPSPAAGLSFAIVAPAPTITALTPDTTPQGSAISMTVTGSGFVPGAVVLFDGALLPTTFVSATQVRAQLGAVQLGVGRVVSVSVQSAGPGGTLSNELSFLVSSPRTTYLPFARK